MSEFIAGLLSPDARTDRIQAKRRAALRWLRDEIWSTPEILGKVMGLSARQGVYQTLAKLERDGFVTSSDIPIFKKSTQRIVGITSHGIAHAFDTDEPLQKRPTFEPSKVKLTTLQHEVDIQKLRLEAEKAGWKGWTPGARLGTSKGGANRPDATVLDNDQKVVAVEVERTIKTFKRYEVILSQYLQSIAKGEYGRVIWVCPTEDLTARLRRIVLSIKAVPIHGKKIALEPRHYQLLTFLPYSKWPNETGGMEVHVEPSEKSNL
jgi:DNA-binding transcriptional ArsR family regulator